MNLFAAGLLEGRSIALAGGVPDTVARELSDLGARVETAGALDVPDDSVGDWAREHGPLGAVVYDAAAAFGAGGTEALVAVMQDAWAAVREVAVGSLLDGGGPGKIVLLGPRPGAGPHVEAVRSGLENLARTVSVEWARHNVTAVMVAPGAGTTEAELAQVVCFLCSPAGEYFSGCRIDLGRLEEPSGGG